MLVNYRVSRDFVNDSDSDLDEFANIVAQCLTGNAAFPTPPVSPVNLAALDLTFRNAIAAATGDPQDTAAKEKSEHERRAGDCPPYHLVL